MNYFCSGCYAEFVNEVAKCSTPYCKGTITSYASVENEEYTVKKTELRCHVCSRVFQGSALINCDNENCPGVIFPTEVKD